MRVEEEFGLKPCPFCGYGWHTSEYDKLFSYCPNCGAKVVE